ncbi:unnamed protein product [Linum trigynum]|uniref:Uncharacterized protein n=1 Tax=Linum trigynum TaxID=586398 RepID=A0AAV2GIG1_9ROSI
MSPVHLYWPHDRPRERALECAVHHLLNSGHVDSRSRRGGDRSGSCICRAIRCGTGSSTSSSTLGRPAIKNNVAIAFTIHAKILATTVLLEMSPLVVMVTLELVVGMPR